MLDPVALSSPVRARILIVEDESVVVDDLEEVLEELGYDVVGTAASGAEAIHHSRTYCPDLILMDIRLQGELDGIEAARQIQQQQFIPIVYLTSHTDEATLQRAKLSAPFGYLTKPFRERELHMTLQVSLYRHGVERQLRTQKHWFNTILDSVEDGIIVVDSHGCIQQINPAALGLLSQPAPQLLHQPIAHHLNLVDEATGQSCQPQLLAAIAHQKNWRTTTHTVLKTADQSIPMDVVVSPLAQEGLLARDGMVITCRNMSDRRKAELAEQAKTQAQKLASEIVELERLSHLKDEFLSTVSHELRSPLANIKMAIQMLTLSLEESGLTPAGDRSSLPRLQHYLTILQTECEREIRLINDLLDLQRLESDAAEPQLQPFWLDYHVESVIESFKFQAERQQQGFTYLVENCRCMVISEPSSLERILGELLHNACKYTPPQESIDVKAVYNPDDLCIQITNSGVTLGADEIARLFDKFYRGQQAERYRSSGTGLGLALVRRLVDRINGTITVKSANNSVCFRVNLPLRPAQT